MLPLAWLAAAVLAVAVTLLGDRLPAGGDADYQVARLRYGLTLAVGFAVFAAVYFALARFSPGGVRPVSGWTHLLLTVAGAALLLAPADLAAPPARYVDHQASFARLRAVSEVGQGLALFGLAPFFAVLVGAFRRPAAAQA